MRRRKRVVTDVAVMQLEDEFEAERKKEHESQSIPNVATPIAPKHKRFVEETHYVQSGVKISFESCDIEDKEFIQD